MRLEEKVALVTGAGRGIGRAAAERFAAEGARVAVNDVDTDAAAETVAAIREAGGEAVSAPADVTDGDQVEAMVGRIVDEWGRLDILINNAGITRDGLTVRIKDGEVRKMDVSDWEAVLNVNLKGSFLCAQAAAVPMIRQQYGKIVNTASVGMLGNIGQANYSASKGGIASLTKTLALELARYNVNVNAVAPGAVKTRMTDAIPEKVMDGLLNGIPFRRLAEPEEVAALHLFLASDDARYITGQVIFVDGGMTVGV